MIGGIQADQSISFQLMEQKLTQFVNIIRQDPAVENVVGFTGGGQTNSGFVFVVAQAAVASARSRSMQVIGRLRPKLNQVAGRDGCSCRRCRTSGSAAARATRNTSTPCRATIRKEIYALGAEGRSGAAKDPR